MSSKKKFQVTGHNNNNHDAQIVDLRTGRVIAHSSNKEYIKSLARNLEKGSGFADSEIPEFFLQDLDNKGLKVGIADAEY